MAKPRSRHHSTREVREDQELIASQDDGEGWEIASALGEGVDKGLSAAVLLILLFGSTTLLASIPGAILIALSTNALYDKIKSLAQKPKNDVKKDELIELASQLNLVMEQNASFRQEVIKLLKRYDQRGSRLARGEGRKIAIAVRKELTRFGRFNRSSMYITREGRSALPKIDDDKVGIVIANFDGPNPKGYRVTEKLIGTLRWSPKTRPQRRPK